ncbi:MAG: GNAT family N-acetyltransferase [Anaerolineae bacterium]|nr:GNAT family N-acetyltransferase [Anaerolineae bacterium]
MPIRPFQMPADFDVLQAVIPPAFQYPENPEWSLRTDELEDIDEQFKNMQRMWPLLRLVMFAWPPLRDAMLGFIWEEDGQPVGTINVVRQGASQTWMIGNVAVLPAYRRRGIARQLVQASIDLARARGSEQIILDVLSGNVPAYSLYTSLGFEHYSGVLEFERQADTPIPEPAPLPAGYALAPHNRAHWQARYGLMQRAMPEAVQRYQPITEARYRVPGWLRPVSRLFDRISGTRSTNWAVRVDGTDAAPALGTTHMRQRKGGTNRISLELDPAHPDLAYPVLVHLLREVQQNSPGRRIEFEVPAWMPVVVEAAAATSCERRFEMHRLGLLLKES